MPRRIPIPSQHSYSSETPAAADVLVPAPVERDRLKQIDALSADPLQRITDDLNRVHQATLALTTENHRLYQAIVELIELQRTTRPTRGDSPDLREENEQLSRLSKREREIYPLLPMSNKEIESALNIAEGTVKFHLGNITRKLGRSRKEILAKNWLERQ